MDTEITLEQIRRWEAELRELGNPFNYRAEVLIERVDAGYQALGFPTQDWHAFWPPMVMHPHKRHIGKPDVRADVWDKTGGRCWYCGKQTTPWRDFCVDHFLAKAVGGSDELGNLVPCCRTCNTRKGDRPIQRLRQLLSGAQTPTFTPEQREYLAVCGIALPEIPAAYVFYFERLEGAGT